MLTLLLTLVLIFVLPCRLPPRVQALTDLGYTLDVVIEREGDKAICVEVDGPTHFVGRSRRRSGATILKQRQLCSYGYSLVSIPYWEWNSPQNSPLSPGSLEEGGEDFQLGEGAETGSRVDRELAYLSYKLANAGLAISPKSSNAHRSPAAPAAVAASPAAASPAAASKESAGAQGMVRADKADLSGIVVPMRSIAQPQWQRPDLQARHDIGNRPSKWHNRFILFQATPTASRMC